MVIAQVPICPAEGGVSTVGMVVRAVCDDPADSGKPLDEPEAAWGSPRAWRLVVPLLSDGEVAEAGRPPSERSLPRSRAAGGRRAIPSVGSRPGPSRRRASPGPSSRRSISPARRSRGLRLQVSGSPPGLPPEAQGANAARRRQAADRTRLRACSVGPPPRRSGGRSATRAPMASRTAISPVRCLTAEATTAYRPRPASRRTTRPAVEKRVMTRTRVKRASSSSEAWVQSPMIATCGTLLRMTSRSAAVWAGSRSRPRRIGTPMRSRPGVAGAPGPLETPRG